MCKEELNRRAEEEAQKLLNDAAKELIQEFSGTMVCTRLDGTTYETPKPTAFYR